MYVCVCACVCPLMCVCVCVNDGKLQVQLSRKWPVTGWWTTKDVVVVVVVNVCLVALDNWMPAKPKLHALMVVSMTLLKAQR